MEIGGIRAIMTLTFWMSLLGFFIYLIISRKFAINRAVREETGERHISKRHVPDMAGIVMLIVYACVYPVFINFYMKTSWDFWETMTWVFYFAPICFGLIGFLDDLMKSRSRSTKGLRASKRVPMQIAVAILIVMFVYYNQNILIPMTWIYAVWLVIFILATINAANFTDGLDGLLSGCAIISILALWFMDDGFDFLNDLVVNPSSYSKVYSPQIIYSVIPITMMITFLFFNTHPAKMFMGDSGSMFIGSFLALLPISTEKTFEFVVIGFVIYFALISVVLQVISFRLTKRRLFPMTPFHHSFEKWGWHENHIIWFYYFLSAALAMFGLKYLQIIHDIFIKPTLTIR